MSTKRQKDIMSVKVGPARYTVRRVESLHMDGQLFGVCKNIDKEIEVRDGMQGEQELQTLLHELLHAIINEYAIRNAANLEPDEEEAIVDLMALGLTQAFASSPQLLKYIKDQLAKS